MTDSRPTTTDRSRWRTRRRWWSIAGGLAFTLVLAGGLELQAWADRHDVRWLAAIFSPGVPIALLAYGFVERWRIARRLGGKDQLELFFRALKDGFLPGEEIGDLHRWRAELTRTRDEDGAGLLLGVGLGGLAAAWWFLWPDEPTRGSVVLFAGVLVAIVVTMVVVVVRDARPRRRPEPGRLVQAIDLRIAAEERAASTPRREHAR